MLLIAFSSTLIVFYLICFNKARFLCLMSICCISLQIFCKEMIFYTEDELFAKIYFISIFIVTIFNILFFLATAFFKWTQLGIISLISSGLTLLCFLDFFLLFINSYGA